MKYPYTEAHGKGHLRRRTLLGGSLASVMLVDQRLRQARAPLDPYVIEWDSYRQTILGLGFEIQSDSIGSGNVGLPENHASVPHDLVQTERERFYREMLRAGGERGFRYCRLALGLFLRGLTEDRKNIVGRWPEQMDELRELVEGARVEGLSVEYWSPAPHWKSNRGFVGGTLRSADQGFLSDFSEAIVRDVAYLQEHGLPVSWWGLQNEPDLETVYSSCSYNDALYFKTFRTAASRLRARFPWIRIHANSFGGQHGIGGAALRADKRTLSLVDAWTWHHIGRDSSELLPGVNNFSDEAADRVVYNNEFEYLQWDQRLIPWYTVNTAQSIMNWMVFHGASIWMWLHALKPTYNSESAGYALGIWRPWDDDNYTHFPDLPKGHWTFNPVHWNALAGFLRHMPWNSIRVEVKEPTTNGDCRIMAWISPDGRRTFALTNRSGNPQEFHVQAEGRFTGSRYSHRLNDLGLGTDSGTALHITVPAYAIEFWTEAT